MRSLFEAEEQANARRAMPLAARMRPQKLDEFVGQSHLLGPGRLLRRLIDADRLGSVIFFGPPGCGKTTLASLLAGIGKKFYARLSAITDGVAQLRQVLAEAKERVETGRGKTVLFIDEIHRFNKTQQDALLGDVESGVIDLVGATTSNPYFAINSALISRSQIFQFQPLTEAEIAALLHTGLTDPERGMGERQVTLTPEAISQLCTWCDGDARQALNVLEIAVLSSAQRPLEVTAELIRECMQRSALRFDSTGEEHYDLASALIKSIRGSDVDAGIYWLARLLESGEDIRFLTRRLVILASEDIGNADPQALLIAVACMQACEFIGLPEGQLTLSQTVAYLACAPKSNACTIAIGAAREDVRTKKVVPVPNHLRDGHYAGAKQLGVGQGYLYAHDFPDGIVAQEYLGVPTTYYQPTDRGFERELAARLDKIRAVLRADGSDRPV
ncbi:MAG: replication-associated recombination protein A [Planctomycetaceae bacterium]|nr:replication-associated recombination protein A [Planctomycetaceae bacterium]